MICCKCGKDIPEEAVFCVYCGERLGGSGAVPAQVKEHVTSNMFKDERNSTQKIIHILCTVVHIAALIIFPVLVKWWEWEVFQMARTVQMVYQSINIQYISLVGVIYDFYLYGFCKGKDISKTHTIIRALVAAVLIVMILIFLWIKS